MQSLYLGVDGGQSGTTALIADETGRVLGEGHAGPCNHAGAEDGREKLVRALTDCLIQACRAAAANPATVRFQVACLGFSGGPHDKETIVAEVIPADRFVVITDAAIALSGATAGEPGIIAIAGTGSIAYGRNASGKTARIGGWGYVFGDEGGAFDLVRQALRAILRHEEGWGSPTSLRDLLLGATEASSANELMHWFYTTDFPRSRIASYAKLVDQAASEGDRVALTIVHDAAGQLANLVMAVKQQIFDETETVRVAYIGGVFNSRIILERFKTLVNSKYVHCAPPAYGPAAGALLEAYRVTGLKPYLFGVPAAEK